VTFLVSGLLILAIRKPKPAPTKPATRPNIRREMGDVYRFIGSNQTLLVMTISGVTLAGAGGIIGGMITLFAISEIGFQPGPPGVMYGIGGVSSLIGALFATRVTNRLGVGNTMVLGASIYGVIGFLIPLAPTQIWIAAIFFILPQLFGDGFMIMHDINRRSLQQSIIPENYLGRVIGAMKVSEMAAALIGVAIAGVVAETVGLRAALFIGSALMVIAAVVLLHPAIRTIKTIPESAVAPKAESTESG
jgi:predicted MFS family arabinose efflux permease